MASAGPRWDRRRRASSRRRRTRWARRSASTAASTTVPTDPDVQANATDSDNATGLFTTFDVHVNNVDPTADLGNDGPINEGGSATVSFSSQFDPSPADTTAGFHYAFSCTNASLAGATYAGSSTVASTSCTFNDSGTFTVRARIIDKDNGFTEYTTNVTVNNVAPTTDRGQASSPTRSTRVSWLGSAARSRTRARWTPIRSRSTGATARPTRS